MDALNLGFRIERHGRISVVNDGKKTWLATPEEDAMWPLVAIAEAAERARGEIHYYSANDICVRADCPRCTLDEALAAFRAAKEEQR